MFSYFGQEVCSVEYARALREDNLEKKRKKERITDFIPQEGFQELVLTSDADISIIGGKRGGGKTWVALYGALEYASNPDVNMYGFRRLEDDIARGIWKSSKPIFRDFASGADSTFEWKFFGGNGATMKMEHLQDAKKVADRFRGVEMAYVVMEEVAEHTRDDMNVVFDLLASNRSTSGVKPRFIGTCNPVGKSNKLRQFLDWWIDPDTDLAIPERSGKLRYFYRFGQEMEEMAWGDSPEEVHQHAIAGPKLDRLAEDAGLPYEEFVTSVTFILGEYSENEMLKAADPKYMSRISARGGESTANDILGIWRDLDSGTSMLSADDMARFFANTEQRDGIMRASADVALTGDFFVIYALDGRHVCDIEAWVGVPSDEVPQFIRKFLSKNSVREENFTYDANGLGLWLKDQFKRAVPFNNKSAPSDSQLWNNLKSEMAEKFVKNVKEGKYSIEKSVLRRTFREKGKSARRFSVEDRLMTERLSLKRKEQTQGGRFEIIAKQQMKAEVGHSPDFIEALFMAECLMGRKQGKASRKGFDMLV